MVEHDIKNDFDTRFMQCFDCIAKLIQRRFWRAGIRRMQRKHRHRVVPPVVTKPHALQTWFAGKLCHRQQLQRGNAQLFQIVDHHRMPQGFISATDLDRNLRVQVR
ncbi:hypothetical protein ExPUPEC79_03693 [Escherichia coli]|nr:hypothetical protein ExPUPEC79_03693 [Escherichia coli]